VIGITLGILLGIAIVVGFVFLGSGDTIDAPSLSGEPGQEQPAAPPAEPGQQTAPPPAQTEP
jgi:hypothetical protein